MGVSKISLAQPFEVIRSGNITLDNASAFYEFIHVDDQSIYLFQRKPKDVVVKFDKSLNQAKSYPFKKPSKSVLSSDSRGDIIDYLGNTFYLFDFARTALESKVVASEIDLETGNLKGSPKELLQYAHDRMMGSDNFRVIANPIEDQFILLASVNNKGRYTFEISIVDKDLNQVQRTAINTNFRTSDYDLHQLVRGGGGEIILLGSNKPTFSNYDTLKLSVYDRTGKELQTTTLELEGFDFNSPRLLKKRSGEVLLGSIYGDRFNEGVLAAASISKINLNSGALEELSFVIIDPNSLSSKQDQKAKEKLLADKSLQGQAEKGKNKPGVFKYNIQSFEENPSDNSIVFTVEGAKRETRINIDGSLHTNQNIMVFKMNPDHKTTLIATVAKNQEEEVGSFTKTWADKANRKTLYSSYSAHIRNNNLYLLFNDHKDNKETARNGSAVKLVRDYDKESSTYLVILDLATGKQTKHFIQENDETGILFVSRAMMYKNEIVVPRWKYPHTKSTLRSFLIIRLK